RVTGGTTEAIRPHVVGVPAPTAAVTVLIQDNLKIMALAAQGVRSIHTQVGRGVEVDSNQLSRTSSLAELVSALQNVFPHGAMRAVGSRAAGFTIVIAVMAVGAENLLAHGAACGVAIEIQHVGEQAGCRDRGSGLHDGMAGTGRPHKLRD